MQGLPTLNPPRRPPWPRQRRATHALLPPPYAELLAQSCPASTKRSRPKSFSSRNCIRRASPSEGQEQSEQKRRPSQTKHSNLTPTQLYQGHNPEGLYQSCGEIHISAEKKACPQRRRREAALMASTMRAASRPTPALCMRMMRPPSHRPKAAATPEATSLSLASLPAPPKALGW